MAVGERRLPRLLQDLDRSGNIRSQRPRMLCASRLGAAARAIAAAELVPFLSHRGLSAGAFRRNAGFPAELVAVPQEEWSGDHFHKPSRSPRVGAEYASCIRR